MFLPEHEREIQGVKYKVRVMPAAKGTRIFFKLAKYLGTGADELDVADEKTYIKAIAHAVMCVDGNDAVDLIKDLAKDTEIRVGDGWLQLSDQFDLHFAGKYGAMMEWIKFVLEKNFSDFLGSAALGIST